MLSYVGIFAASAGAIVTTNAASDGSVLSPSYILLTVGTTVRLRGSLSTINLSESALVVPDTGSVTLIVPLLSWSSLRRICVAGSTVPV